MMWITPYRSVDKKRKKISMRTLPTYNETLYTVSQFKKTLQSSLVTTINEVIRPIHTSNSNKYLYKEI